jgi:nucleotide-binding universal stress UspA family protein
MRQARFHAEQLLGEARKCSQEGSERLRRVFPDWRIRADAVADSPYWGLVKQAEQLQANLLVVGSQGRSALGRLMLGSVSQNAVLYAPCSTRVGRRRDGRDLASGSTPVRIIIGWDGSADAAHAAKAAASRRWPAGSQVRMVTALDLRLSTALPSVVPADLIARGSPPFVPDESDLLREGARAASEALRGSGLAVEEPVLREGDPKRVLIDEAETCSADCIFVGAKGMSRVERVLLGSVSNAVAARAACSVEVVRGKIQAPT